MAKELKKGSLIRRIGAYIIDYILIVMLISFIASPFTDAKKIDKLQKQATEIIEKYQNDEITAEEYTVKYSDIYYKLSRTTGIVTFITIIIGILYYIVFQFYNKGQTLGKKALNIKVISTEGDLTMNQLMFRSLICNTILLNIINFGLITFGPKSIYTTVSVVLTVIQYLVVFISVILATTKEGRTIHDRITHTRVVSAK